MLMLPDLSRQRTGKERLRGLRLIHTHLKEEPLTRDDLMDLACLRLDMVTALKIGENGDLKAVESAHLVPDKGDGRGWDFIHEPEHWQIDFSELISSVENGFARSQSINKPVKGGDNALCVSIATQSVKDVEASLTELKKLCHSAGLKVVGVLSQRVKKHNPRHIIGKGKLSELLLACLNKGANFIVFDQPLNPSQIRSITRITDLKVIDRTQLILDIFAHRAKTREGKIQVEIAQLKYLLPHLVYKDDALSRLTGGIGGRGPGETKLEINKRRVRERLHRLENEKQMLSKQRKQRRSKRNRQDMPVISIIGYTNAGKSTLLNTLTSSSVDAEDKLFATLDPCSRRLRFPREREVIITDTVGFIDNLPSQLLDAFSATLEELEDASLLLHVVDMSDPAFNEQIKTVNHIISKLELDHIPALYVFNKMDLLSFEKIAALVREYNAIPVSAIDKNSLSSLLERIENKLEQTIIQ